MRRTEVVDMIKDDLQEFLDNYHNSTESRKKYLIENTANGIIDLIEGLGYQIDDKDYWENNDEKSGAV